MECFAWQGKFIRIHFGTNGKIAGADIETCEDLHRFMYFINIIFFNELYI